MSWRTKMILNFGLSLSVIPRFVLFGGLAAMGSWVVDTPSARTQTNTAQITVLYDAFGKTSTMKKDWGFAALIEYGGKPILFDTGNDADIFAHSVAARGIAPRRLAFAVTPHRHGDHTSGLTPLPKVNPA